jgi:hypothetical protein
MGHSGAAAAPLQFGDRWRGMTFLGIVIPR